MKLMKKYLFIILAGAALLAAACQEEQPTYEIHDNINVVSQNIVFMPQGGSGSIVVEAESAITATSDRPWCNVSVSGMTVTVTVPEWTGKENRYAKITLQSGQEKISLTAQQFGEVLGGLDITDISSPFEGTTQEINFVSNLPVTMTANQSWIHVTVNEETGTVKIVIDPNTESGTRIGAINYSVGSHPGTINVLQYPETVRVNDWSASVVDGNYTYPNQTDVIGIQSNGSVANDKYVYAVVDKSKVSNVEDYAFSVVALEKRNEILAKVESGQYASFADGLSTGNLTETFQNLDPDSGVYVIIVGYGDNGYVTGKWAAIDLTIEDREPMYYKWTGTWNITGRTVPYTGQTFTGAETWTITKDESDVESQTLTVRGMNSLTTASIVNNDAAALKMKYNAEDGSLEFRTQHGKTFVYSDSYGDCYMFPQGLYTKNGTSWSRVSTMDVVIFKAQLNLDNKTVTITPGIRTSDGVDYNYDAFRLYFFRIGTSGTYSLNASVSSGVIPLPFEMTRAAE